MKSEPLYRRPLNEHQITILHTLYRFRFTTTELLMQSLGVKNKNKMNLRLRILLDQEYIGRNFKPSYHLSGRHASFYLEAKGINALKGLPDSKYSTSVLRNMYKDKAASERFINHWLIVFEIYLKLKSTYGDRLKFVTKSQLSNYTYFPKQLPDAYIRLAHGKDERHYFLEMLDSSQPFFVQNSLIKKYIKYEEEGDWEDATGTSLPTALLLCDTPTQAGKLIKYADREIDDFDSDDSPIVVTSKGEIGSVLDA